MDILKWHKVTSLPGIYEPSAVYFVQSSDNVGLMDIYVSNAAGTSVRSVLKQDQVLAMIQEKMDSMMPTTFEQLVPSAEWNITHAYPYRPDVKIIDSAGDEVIGDITYPSATQVQILFSAPFSGSADLS